MTVTPRAMASWAAMLPTLPPGAEDQQRLARLEAEVLQHPERGLADRDDGRRGLEGQPRRLGHRPVEQGVLAVAAGGGGAEDLVADRRARAVPGGVHHARHVPAGQHRERAGKMPSRRPLRILASIGLTATARTWIRTWPGPGRGTSASDRDRTSGPP